MNAILVAVDQSATWLQQIVELFVSANVRIAIAAAMLGTALVLLLPGRVRRRKWLGGSLGVIGVGLIWSLVPLASSMSFQSAFWFLASIAVVASTATVTSRSPVYSAIWFAVSVLGVAGLFMLQGAQFLGVATVAVYAGAIVVTFLFVLMLAQPEGLSFYDRIPWGSVPRLVVPFMAATLMALLASVMTRANADHIALRSVVERHVGAIEGLSSKITVHQVTVGKYENNIAEIHVAIAGSESELTGIEATTDALKYAIAQQLPKLDDSVIRFKVADSLRHPQHVAHLGGNLFGRYLIAIQLAGCLLLVALVARLQSPVMAVTLGRPSRRLETDMNEFAILQNYLLVGAILFSLGLTGFLIRRSMIVMFLCAEMMLQGISLSLIAWGRFHNDWGGQMLVVFIIAVAACEAAIVLSLILMLCRKSNSLDIICWQNIREEGMPPYLDREVPEESFDDAHWPTLTPAGVESDIDPQKNLHRTDD